MVDSFRNKDLLQAFQGLEPLPTAKQEVVNMDVAWTIWRDYHIPHQDSGFSCLRFSLKNTVVSSQAILSRNVFLFSVGEGGGKTKKLKEVVQIRYLKPVLQNPSCTSILRKPLYNACSMAVFVVQSCTSQSCIANLRPSSIAIVAQPTFTYNFSKTHVADFSLKRPALCCLLCNLDWRFSRTFRLVQIIFEHIF